MHDMNLVVLVGRVAAEPQVRSFPTGAQVIEYTITSRVEEPRRRVDVIPVYLWVMEGDEEPWLPEKGEPILAIGAVQRRFWDDKGERKSRIEVIAEEVSPVDPERAPALLIDVTERIANGGEEG
jgi:single-strand DNA-binding protein